MCIKCVEAVDEIFPEKKGDAEFLDYILWNETPFPMGSHEQVREALIEAKRIQMKTQSEVSHEK